MDGMDARDGSARHAGGVSDPCVPPLLLAVDGDSMLHRAHHAMQGSEQRDDAGRPTWALRGLVSFIATAAARLTPDAVVVGFDSREDSVRKADFAGYKAQRADKPHELQAQLDDAPGLLAAAGLPVVVATGFEADDVLASAAALARRSGWRATLVTSDRDSFALIDETTSVLRVLNGGMEGSPVLTPQKLPSVCGVMPGQYRDFAALRGDTSDNLPGARGIGSKTAAKLLSVFRSLDDAYAAFDGGRAGELDAAIGKAATARLTAPEAREFVLRNQRLMAMHDDLVLPDLAAMKIPLDAERLRATLAARGVRLGSSLWALVGEQAPPWLPAGYDRAPQYLPRVEPPQLGSPPERIDLPQPAGPFRRLVVLPRRGLKPVLPGQLTLF
jgi:5'-3' exonuclease